MAASYTLAGPSVLTVAAGQPATFTVTLNATHGSAVNVTPASDKAGVFTPPVLNIPIGQTVGTFTFAPAITGTHAISTADDASLSDPSAVNLVVIAAPAVNATTQRVRLSWAATSNAEGYDVFLNGELIGNGSGLEFTYRLAGQSPIALSFTVNAYRRTGNGKRLLASGTASVALIPDNVEKTVTLS